MSSGSISEICLGNYDRFVEAVEILQRTAQSMQRVGELWISGHGLAVLLDGLLVMAFENQIERGVVVMLGLFTRACGAGWIVGHSWHLV